MSMDRHEKIQEFVEELSGFANTAEQTLKKIEENKIQNRSEFHVFSERMIAIRGTALQLGLPHIAEIAGLGEEIAIKGSASERASQIRKCIGSLWDALTTIKFLLQNYDAETGEEQAILIRRLQSNLDAFGGAREQASAQDIEALLKSHGRG